MQASSKGSLKLHAGRGKPCPKLPPGLWVDTRRAQECNTKKGKNDEEITIQED